MSGTPEPGDLQRNLGRNLRAWRKARGWTQEVLAEELDVHRTYVCGIERGRRNPSLTMLERMAQRLRVSVSELLAE